MPDNIQQKIEALREELHQHNYNYYILDEPSISDFEFDAKLKELQELETAHPEFYDANSPSLRVGGGITKNFPTIQHQFRMYSLDNSYDFNDLEDWENRILKTVENEEVEFVAELKYDGASISILYENGELKEAFIAKFLLQVRDSYFIAPFTLDSVAKNPEGSLQALKEYDLAVIAKPSEAFSESEKQVLDQYLMNGGKTIWLVDQVVAEIDSLYNPSGASLAYPRDLNINDLFFKYGIRINPDIVKDEQGSPIQLASGEPGSATRFQQFNWKYAPLVTPISTHPIVKNLGGIKFDFANSIDTLKNSIKKTVLLQSSPYSKRVGTPTAINLSMVSETTSPADYPNTGGIPLAVLLEGSFHSAFENRIKAFEQTNFQSTSKPTKMIVISDGDILRNQLDKNQLPVELGYDQRSGNLYDNKDFLMNSVNYLLDDSGLINIRSKDLDLPLLDKEKVYANYTYIQVLTIGLPILILGVFGLLFTYFRKRNYAR